MHQHQGDREYQQDIMTINPNVHPNELCTVADGMGGYEGGEIASALIGDQFREMIIDGDDMGEILERTLSKANEAIADYKEEHSEVKSMGSTLISAYFTESSVQWISVGDSLLYRTECYDKIERINDNHSIAGLLELQLKQGEITQKEVDENPNKHMLTSALTGEEITTIDLSSVKIRNKNQIFILASDGLETLSEAEILETLQQFDCSRQAGLNEAAIGLIDAVLAKKKRNQDNVTVLLVSNEDLPCEHANAAARIKARRNQTEANKQSTTMDIKKISMLGGLIVILALLLWQIFGGSPTDDTPVDKNDTNKSVTTGTPSKNGPIEELKDRNVSLKTMAPAPKPLKENTKPKDTKKSAGETRTKKVDSKKKEAVKKSKSVTIKVVTEQKNISKASSQPKQDPKKKPAATKIKKTSRDKKSKIISTKSTPPIDSDAVNIPGGSTPLNSVSQQIQVDSEPSNMY